MITTFDPAAGSFAELIEAPIAVGHLREWHFTVSGIDHTIAYQPSGDTVQFDTAHVVDAIARLATAGSKIFGSLPDQRYAFILEDGAFGALEHPASLTLGLRPADLARDRSYLDGTIAHEFFHAWNLMHLRPREYHGVEYRLVVATPLLWWSEGVTMYYARQLMLRSGLIDSATATRQFEESLTEYLENPGNALISPERASLNSDHAELNDGLYPSYYAQGSLFAALLDETIRDKTRGANSLDDAMRALDRDYGGDRGVIGADVIRVADSVCACKLDSLFASYVSSAGSVVRPLADALARHGHTLEIDRHEARDSAGKPLPDHRLYIYRTSGATTLRLIVQDPESCWWNAGLRTGDELLEWNGAKLANPAAFNQAVQHSNLGDTAAVHIRRANDDHVFRVVVSGYTAVTAKVR